MDGMGNGMSCQVFVEAVALNCGPEGRPIEVKDEVKFP